jgi:hypothetical protein
MYCDGLEELFNQDVSELKRFAFKIFDVNQDKKLSENDMFELMKSCQTLKDEKDKSDPAEILHLNQFKQDLFIDVFFNDYVKIIEAIERKKKATGQLHDEPPSQKIMAQIQLDGTKLQAKGQAKFGKRKNLTSTKQSQILSDGEQSNDEDKHKKSEKGEGVKKGEVDDKTFSISSVEFQNINFGREWPMVIQDLSSLLTGFEFLKSLRISEQEELNQTLMAQDVCKESEL